MKDKITVNITTELLDALTLACNLLDAHFDQQEADVRKFKRLCSNYIPQHGEEYVKNKNIFDIQDKTIADIQKRKEQSRKLIMFEIVNKATAADVYQPIKTSAPSTEQAALANQFPAREKIGVGYWQSGYGKGFHKTAIIYLINGKAYAKDKRGAEVTYETDLTGYVMVNKAKSLDGGITFSQIGRIEQHKKFVK